MSAKTVDTELLARLHQESEDIKDQHHPETARCACPNRTQAYSVRLSAEEQARVGLLRGFRGRQWDLFEQVPPTEVRVRGDGCVASGSAGV